MPERHKHSYLMNNYRRLPISFTHGSGCWLYDQQEKAYLDTTSGIAVCNLGHCHPRVTQTIAHQAATLMHTSNIYQIELQQKLGAELAAISGMESSFFCNSGAEANETAIKLARLYGHKKGISIPHILVTEGSFHGRTMATLSATANRKVQAGFEPLVPGFIRAPFNDLTAIRTIAENNPNICAVLIEPIQGEGGVHIPAEYYLSELRDICDEHEWLMMLDEIQTGNGRTGKYFAYQHTPDLHPDIITTAKGLGNGFPIGACLARGAVSQLFEPGHHGSTFGGNPLACATALTVIETLFNEGLIERAHKLGHYLLTELKTAFEQADYVEDIRGKGLMIGIELKNPCRELMGLALTQQLLINVTSDKVIRLLPPLVMSDEEAELMLKKVCKLIKVYAGDDRSRPRTNTNPS